MRFIASLHKSDYLIVPRETVKRRTNSD